MPDIFTSEKPEVKKPEPRPVAPASHINRKTSLKAKALRNFSPLSAFVYFPNGVNFETKQTEEKIVLMLRRHPITNVPWIVLALVMFLAPAVLDYFPLLDFLPGNFQFVAILTWYLITIAFALEQFLSWFFNVNIITDERIVDIDFYNIIYKEVSDTKLDKIQDATFKMGSVVRTVFNYGDVFIRTASEVPEFEFLAVPKPDVVVKILNELVIEEEQEKIEGRVR